MRRPVTPRLFLLPLSAKMKVLCSLLLALPLAAAKITLREHQLQLELAELQAEDAALERIADVPTVHWETVSLPISYADSTVGNFTNRYWVVDDFYKPGGPVFVLDTGESYGGDQYLGHLTRNTSFLQTYMREFNALGIVWEHRYYGESMPTGPIDIDTPAEKLKYLDTESALEDFVVWAEGFAWGEEKVRPGETPWVVFGGSYPGMRAAMLRELYPETVYAAYASSAPVQAQKDMSVCGCPVSVSLLSAPLTVADWEQVYRGMQRYKLGNCTAAVKLAVDHIDIQLSRPSTSKALKLQWLGRTAEKASNEGFADTLHFPFWNWQARGADPVLVDFCQHLTAAKPPKKSLAGKFYADRWGSWTGFKELVNEYITTNGSYCEGPVRDDTTTPNCQLDGKFEGAFSVAWTWQYCTEWGFFQHTNAGPHALGSRYDDIDHQQEICYRQFPDGIKSGLLPREPRTEYINKVTGGWNMRPSNVFWTGGEFDPWRTLSPLSAERWAPDVRVREDVPACGTSTSRRELFGHLLLNSEHCYDLRAVEQAKRPNELFGEALGEWLKCFVPRGQ
jgi:hypothetical protein